jgi:hypothetical protein
MRLSHLTFTGADDSVDPEALARISARDPLVEWGLLFDAERCGQPRFPSEAWRREFYRAAPHARRAAHVCGLPLLSELAAVAVPSASMLGSELCGESTLQPPFGRIQLNFDAQRLPLAVLTGLVAGWRGGRWRRADGAPLGLITQHNEGNRQVHELFAETSSNGMRYPAFYSVLFDASGGRGLQPAAWPARPPGLACGYAGGIAEHNITALLRSLAATESEALPVWFDAESGVRSGERFDLDKVGKVIEAVRAVADADVLEPNQPVRPPRP